MVDRKGILWFLGIVFAVTYAMESALLIAGLRLDNVPSMYGQMIVVVAMWVPTVAAWITTRFITKEPFSVTRVRLGPVRPYLESALVVPAAFIVTYGLTWLLGLGQPDWNLTWFLGLMTSAGATLTGMPPVGVVLGILFVASLTVGPIVNSLFALGEEIGWRGFLLPRLMPLGKAKAYCLMGAIWALWHLPMILAGFVYPGQPVLGILAFVALLIAFGIYLNELSLRYRSSVLAGWVHGLFNAQKLGVWALLFPGVNPLVGGYAGLVGIAVWLVIGFWVLRRSDAA